MKDTTEDGDPEQWWEGAQLGKGPEQLKLRERERERDRVHTRHRGTGEMALETMQPTVRHSDFIPNPVEVTRRLEVGE